ncbi:MAG: hypothetical protein GVY36_11345 [Verrucomicrobia bacterium]|nr:hypothetical protein [Verrucomicrobiota bacterium]
MRLYLDGEFVRQENVDPYEWGAASPNDAALRDMDPGNYTLTAIATDTTGASSETSITVSVGGNASLYIEAEDADNLATGSFTPFQVLNDAGASGGEFIEVAPGNNSFATMPNDGYAEYTFSIASAAEVTVHFRVQAPSGTDDSFWVRMDGGTGIKFNAIAPGSAWHWDQVHDNNSGNTPVTWNLSAGTHTLRVAYREDGTKLDRLYISSDGSQP